MNNRIFVTGALFFVCSMLFAQVQKGVVRTAERPGKPSKKISLVTIRPDGEYNPSVSDESGEFSIMFRGLSDGDGFKLKSVKKNGYEVASEALSRTYVYSSRVPLEVVMYNSAEMQQEKQVLAERYAEKMMADARKEIEELQEQLKAARISEQDYQRQLGVIYDRTDKRQELIDRMSDVYVRTDYAHLDSLDRVINLLIEQGEFEKADALIRSKGDPDERVMLILSGEEEQVEREQRTREGRILQDKRREEGLSDFYNLYTTAMSRSDYDEAEHQLRLLLKLAPYNVQYYCDLGVLLYSFKSEFSKAMEALQDGIDHIKARYGENEADLCLLYARYADVLDEVDRYYDALDYYRLAEKLILENPDTYGSISLASVYHNMANTYLHLGLLSPAEDIIIKVLDIYNNNPGGSKGNVASAYSTFSLILQNKGQFVKSMEYAMKSLELRESIPEGFQRSISVAYAYTRIAGVHEELGEYAQAIVFYEKALGLFVDVYGDNSPSVAEIYNKLGNVYFYQHEHEKGGEYFDKALAMQIGFYGDNGSRVGYTLNNIGNMLKAQGQHNKAREMYSRSLTIILEKTGEDNLYTARTLLNMASLEKWDHNFETALKYANQVLDMINRNPSDMEASLAVPCLTQFGSIYQEMAIRGYTKMDVALSYYLQALEKLNGMEKANPVSTAALYEDMSQAYAYANDFDNALSYINKAIDLYSSALGSDSDKVAEGYIGLGNVYNLTGQMDDALAAYSQSLEINESRFPSNHPFFIAAYQNISRMYAVTGDFDKELFYLKKTEDAMAQNPEGYRLYHTGVQYRLGYCYQQLGDMNNAIHYFEKAIDDPSPYSDQHIQAAGIELGTMYFLSGRINEAEDCLRKIVPISVSLYESEPEDNIVNYWSNLNNLGYLLFVEEKFDESGKYLQEAYDLIKPRSDADPSMFIASLGNTLVNQCFLYMTTGNMAKLSAIAPEANDISKILYEADPESFTSYYVTTLKCMYLTDAQNAAHWLETLGKVDPQDPDYLQLTSPQ